MNFLNMKFQKNIKIRVETIIIYALSGLVILLLNGVVDEGMTFVSGVASIGGAVSKNMSSKYIWTMKKMLGVKRMDLFQDRLEKLTGYRILHKIRNIQ